MSESYAREILRRNVAQICQTIGWNGINSTPLDILVHVLEKYIRTVGTQASRYAEQFNRTEPNLNDLGLVFQDLNVQIPELAEYTRCVPSVPLPIPVDKFPKPKESNLNFLKPGSHEVVTRPMHVHEHLPPMYPEKERDTPAVAGTVEIQQNGVENNETGTVACASPEISVTDSPEKPKDIFKRPTDPVSLPNSKRPRLRLDEEERTREISSVMMTMSGFLSPAREGKLPEARPPTIMSEKHTEKHKTTSHHANPAKVSALEKSDKKSKKNKLINGKIMKSKRKDKSHKGESSKSKDGSKTNKHPPGHVKAAKDAQHSQNHVPKPAPKATVTGSKPVIPPAPLAPELVRPVIKQEPVDPQAPKNSVPSEDAIPVPRKIPISKSPLVSNTAPVQKPSSTNTLIPETEIKKETIDDEEKLASQPDRSKINIFKRISNKSKEDKISPEVVPEKSQSDSMISKVQSSAQDNPSENKKNENIKVKSDETLLNNNDNSTVDFFNKAVDLRAHEVISIVDDDSMDATSAPQSKAVLPHPNISLDKTLQVPYSKDIASVSPKIKKEKKHKDKKDKSTKLVAKLLKKQQQQLAFEMAQAEKQNVKMGNIKPSKSSRPKNESNVLPQIPPHQYIPYMSLGRNLLPGPGLIPNSTTLLPGASDFLAGFASNPALRGFTSSPNLLTNPFALGAGGPGLISGGGFLQSGIPNPLMHSFPQSSRSSSVKIPPMLRRPSLEVIPVDNDDERDMHKPPMMGRDKDRHEKHKSPTIPNILQKHKSKSHKDKSSIYKMPPVQPDITIELNPPKVETVRQEPPKEAPIRVQSPTPEPVPLPKLDPIPPPPQPSETTTPLASEVPPDKDVEQVEKKKEKSHKKEKRDKDGTKIKKKKDKKDKTKDKSERKKEKVEMKEKLKKEKKEKKREKEKEKEKEKSADGLVPKLTLKLSSSNSNSPMPPSSPDVFKLNIKPVVKKEEEEISLSKEKEEPVSREHSHSPELAQISALVTRPPKQKLSKQNHSSELEPQSSSPPTASSPPSKHRPPSSHSKYKRILFKSLSKKGHFEDDMTSMSEEPAAEPPPAPAAEPSAPLPTPYYIDEHGNKIWVCPACGRPDNGSPMIGCDGCDGWYHWVCVGITEEPGASEDWFCQGCISKLGTMPLSSVSSGKKRGRKPKGEKIRDCH